MTELFAGESMVHDDGYPMLVRYFPSAAREKSTTGRPLVVFFPGWAHLGRIAYGYPGCTEEHFLAPWITRLGYPFLATSYPLAHPVFDRPYPAFGLRDWGACAAAACERIIGTEGLSRRVIGVSWSAAGQVIRPFNVACRNRGIEVCFHLAIEGTPALVLPPDRTGGITKTAAGLVSIHQSHYPLFRAEIAEMEALEGTAILPDKEHLAHLWGDFPVGLAGTLERFRNGGFRVDATAALEDKGFFQFAEYPLVAAISGTSRVAPYHPLVDRATWSFLAARALFHGGLADRAGALAQLSADRFEALARLFDDLPRRLHVRLPGNHFLFLGRRGARATSEALAAFAVEIERLKTDLASILVHSSGSFDPFHMASGLP